MSDDLWERFIAAVAEELPAAHELRKALHREPQLSGEEGPTLERVLRALGEPAHEAVAETGAIVRIGSSEAEAIAIRAELDALPIREETGVAWSSNNENMHACGHDVHIAAAVAVVRAAQRVELPAPLVLILQPREEAYPSGARDICESGVLERHRVREVFGAHVHPRVPAGGVAIGAGAVNAAADEFRVTVLGTGGHAAYPQQVNDPIVALAAIVGAAQTLVSRRVDPMHPAVVSFGTLEAGSAANVIPSEASARGSMRTMNPEDREFLHRELPRIAATVAESFGCSARVDIIRGEPVLFNDHELAAAVRGGLSASGISTEEPMRSCGADDFSYYSERFVGVMMFVGAGDERPGAALHTASFLPRVEAVRDIALAYAVSIRESLRLRAAPGSNG